MIDFSTLQGLTIPEGVVTQIADESGRVLWSAVKPLTVTITKVDQLQTTATGHLYYMKGAEKVILSQVGTYEVPAGTKMFVYCDYTGDGSDLKNDKVPAYVYMKSGGGSFTIDDRVATGDVFVSPLTYEFVLNSNISVSMQLWLSVMDIKITET